MKPSRRHAMLLLAASVSATLCLPSVISLAQSLPDTISAPQALQAATSGDAVLVDIRSRQEWADTGVAQPALPISMHEPGFIPQLLAAIGNDRTRPVALICATGGRTRYMQYELRKLGFTNVTDVSEGMLGSSTGPGWLKRGLAVKRLNP